jgi:hypothetical protein
MGLGELGFGDHLHSSCRASDNHGSLAVVLGDCRAFGLSVARHIGLMEWDGDVGELIVEE